MENNSQYDELLIKYLVNEADAEEKAFVENWMNAGKENRQYFEGLKNAWQLAAAKQTLDYVLDEMNVDDRWNRFKQAVAANQAKVVSIPAQEQFEDESAEDQHPGRKSFVYRMLIPTAVAASVLLVIGLGRMLFTGSKQETIVVQNPAKKPDSVTFAVRHEVNTTGKEKSLRLPDGSLLVLANNSEVTYREPFGDKRDVTLTGKAFFKVAKDKTRPFTVFSGDISTTALGTEFTVTTFGNTNRIVVRLYEGKVVVKPVNKANKAMKNDVYLLPGQAFVYGGQTIAEVKEFRVNRTVAPGQIMNEEMARDNPSLPGNTEGSWYQFNNQSLAEVFDNLSQMFNVPIAYETKDVRNIYFTAKYNRTDSLKNILKEIATLHNLTVTAKDNAFIISK